MHGYEATGLIVDFLRKSNRAFCRIHFFDVAGASASAACEFTNVSPSAIGQFFQCLNFRSFCARDAIAITS